jgi:arginyl-tRNA synthetase
MKNKIKDIIYQSIKSAHAGGDLPSEKAPDFEIDEPKFEAHGDFSSNAAMVMAASQKMPPRKIAESIVRHIQDDEGIFEKVEIAGPGFVNFFIQPAAWYPVLKQIHEPGGSYGAINLGGGKKIQIEFVSANPTGPLHVGHGRGAAVGDSVAKILSFCGYDVQREYYINDAGTQIKTLGKSVFLRLRELDGEAISFPEDCYQGDYIVEIAKHAKEKMGHALSAMDEEEAITSCARLAAEQILDNIRIDLEGFGVIYDRWFSEQAIYDSGKVDQVIKDFEARGIIYENDGARWFRTSDFGDEKDRVVVRSNGQTTYFASDIAYHQDKYDRGFDRVIDVWGADHHGYIPRMSASVQASGRGKSQFNVILVRLVNLMRSGEPVAMSTRAGKFVTLKDVVDEVGADAARFIFLTRHYESPLDFDLDLAKKKSNENPVYYVQYVHARISSVIRKGMDKGLGEICWDDAAVASLTEPEELNLIKTMARYPEVILSSAEAMEPHRVAFFLMNLAAAFHAYYNKHRVLTDDPVLARGRLYLIVAVQKVIRNGLTLLGVSAPDQM